MTTLFADCEPAVDALQRAEKLFLEANRRTDEFLATLGHELRNPLSALSNALQVWPLAVQNPVQMEELRNIMLRQVRQLTRLSDDLLDVARIAQGKLELRLEPIQLGHLIAGACEEVRPFIDRCGHVLSVDLPAQPLVVSGDASRLTQVFANLIQNAAKFTERNGSLEVSVAVQSGTALIRVRDNGAGIAEEMRSAIFEAFSQVHGNSPLGEGGLGIGLRLVKTIVELHGGEVDVRSDGLGCGSEFIVQLPLLPNCVPTEPTANIQLDAGQTSNGAQPPAHQIVVVDDDRSSAELVAWMLRSIGQTVTVVNNGASAIQRVLEERPQVVFLDIVMRGLDGIEVARRLRGHPELAGVVLIALSGNADDKSKRRALDAGFDQYLVKPTSIAALTRLLSHIPAGIRADEPRLQEPRQPE